MNGDCVGPRGTCAALSLAGRITLAWSVYNRVQIYSIYVLSCCEGLSISGARMLPYDKRSVRSDFLVRIRTLSLMSAHQR